VANQAPNEEQKIVKKRVPGASIWYFFNSLKLTLGVLLTVAVVSVLGTFIQQNEELGTYYETYGEKWADLILTVGANDMYHTWWFTALLVMLTLNIIVCTFERFPPKWKSLLSDKPNYSASFIERLSNSRVFSVEADVETARARTAEILRRKGYKFTEDSSGSSRALYAKRGVIGRFGSDVTHISLLLILLGAIIGSVWGYKDMLVITVGNSATVKDAAFTLRLDKFWIDYYDSGQIRQFNSNVTVVEDGKDVLTKQIWVNEPLYYKGIRFYQSTYGMSWKEIKKAQVTITEGATKQSYTVMAPWQENTVVPGTHYTIKPVAYVADFAFDETMKVIYSKSLEANNPAVNVEIYRKGERIGAQWLFMKYPDLFSKIGGTEDRIVLNTYQPSIFSGISVNKDPGTNVVWLGTVVMGIGFYLAFFVFHRRVWVHITPGGSGSEVRVGAMINKNTLVIERDLKEIVEAVSGKGSKT
jgi:cytochrome c biogenesis protein